MVLEFSSGATRSKGSGIVTSLSAQEEHVRPGIDCIHVHMASNRIKILHPLPTYTQNERVKNRMGRVHGSYTLMVRLGL